MNIRNTVLSTRAEAAPELAPSCLLTEQGLPWFQRADPSTTLDKLQRICYAVALLSCNCQNDTVGR